MIATETDVVPAQSAVRDVSIATAGHVDHGKSTLVRILTGTDPDRLPEERRREMTIELGFASLARPDGSRLAFIDVPGHERLVETMVAGVGGIDAALLVVAADDGPMPQTIEHLRILGLLGLPECVVAITRTDLVDADWLHLAIASVRDLLHEHGLEHAPVIPVSAVTGDGVDDLRDCLLAVPPRPRMTGETDVVWLPIDRSFHRHGVGTIVAGTLAHGQLHRGDTVAIWPGGLKTTVRQLQRHNQPIESAIPGQRVAANLAGISLDQVTRGKVLSRQPVPAIETVDIRYESIGSLPRSGDLVRVMIGTDRVDATIQLVRRPGTPGLDHALALARLRFRRPVATVTGDRLIVRRPSPAATLGGGVVLARYAGRPPRLDGERRADLAALAVGDPGPTLRRRLAVGPISIAHATEDLPGAAMDILRRWLQDGTVRLVTSSAPVHETLRSSSIVIAGAVWLTFVQSLRDDLASYHADEPETLGLPVSRLRNRSGWSASDLDHLLERAVGEGHVVRRHGIVALPGHRPRLRDAERPVAERLLRQSGARQSIQVMLVRDILPTTIDYLERSGEIVRIDDDRIMSAGQFEIVARWVIETSRSRPVDLPTVRDQVGLGRDTVQRLLECFDRMALTVRRGDGRHAGPAADEWLSAQDDRHDLGTDTRS